MRAPTAGSDRGTSHLQHLAPRDANARLGQLEPLPHPISDSMHRHRARRTTTVHRQTPLVPATRRSVAASRRAPPINSIARARNVRNTVANACHTSNARAQETGPHRVSELPQTTPKVYAMRPPLYCRF